MSILLHIKSLTECQCKPEGPTSCRAPATPSPTPPTAGPSGGTGAIESASTQLQALTTSEGVIYGVDGGELAISGVTWYGFDNGTSLFGLEVSPHTDRLLHSLLSKYLIANVASLFSRGIFHLGVICDDLKIGQ